MPPKRCQAYNIGGIQCRLSARHAGYEHEYADATLPLREAGRELADLAEEANGDPSSCSYNTLIGERVKELRKVFR